MQEDLEGQKGLGCQDIQIENIGNVNQNSFGNPVKTSGVGNVNTPEVVLGMSAEKAIELWHKEGAPVIHLGPGENCEDLEKLLSNPNVLERHLEVVRAWLDKQDQKPGGQEQ